jgi:hypothetical protein
MINHMAAFGFALAVLCAAPLSAVRAEDKARELVKDGASVYTIYYDRDAPSSVRDAAREIQKYIRISTGAELPLSNTPKEPMISAGDTKEARAAGIDPDKLPADGFRIETKGANIFISGKDVPEDKRSVLSGMGEGTYYGAMEFIERFIGVRWLMPAEGGEDVPSRKTLTIPDISLTDAPDLTQRIASRQWIGDRKINDRWLRLMRVSSPFGADLTLDYNHAWDCYNMPEKLKGHPEFMAMTGGRRIPIGELRPENGKSKRTVDSWKFCASNPALVELFTGALLEEMVKKPEKKMWSICPNDGGGWCECENCRALDEDCAWPGARGDKSVTPRVVAFYNEVAKRVRAKYPDKMLGGFIYAFYTYPPAKPVRMEPNLFLVLGARPYYGYSLYHPELAAELPRLIGAWAPVIPGGMGWLDYSTWVGLNKCFAGAPYPPGTEILKMVFSALKKNNVKMAHWDTAAVEGYGALYSYLACKLMWRADADVDALMKEWLDRAYGPGGEPMRRLYALLESKLSDYKKSPKEGRFDFQYRCVPEQVKAIHLPLLPQMEELYKEALSKTGTPDQKRRLEMFGDNMVLLHWNMRKAGWLDNPEKSIFYRSDDDFKKFAEEKHASPSICFSGPLSPEKLMTPALLDKSKKPVSKQD